ncbi:AAA family ATPase [Actinomadura sp. DC4]|uniref:MinD/ParA family ATP-binding protein n=1 Tax=Actinomadura sp. DC4 TaxID=3055069 RepID=UPI0025B1125C|nr:AAA family ATPase [Actinomadura sp. DC4]MDN3352991.1 AAA family ATPase [Actinomadura sp. DC4]
MSGAESGEPSEEDSSKESEVPADAWTNTPPAPTFPSYGAPAQDPSAADAPQPYGYGFPGYPPQDFGGVHQPPQFPGAPGQEYTQAQYQQPEQAYEPPAQETGPPNGGGVPPNGAGAPEAERQYDDGERTQYVEPRPAADATQTDAEGFPTYSQYPPPQYGQQPEQGYPQQQQYYAPPPGAEQGPPPYPYPSQPDYEQTYQQQQPYPQQYAPPPGPEYGQAYPQQYAPPPVVEQGPPLAPLPDAYAQPLEGGGQTADSLSAEMLLRGRRHAPAGGWRRAVYKASGGVIHPGESPQELRKRELLARARTPVAGGHHRVAVMSLKGGVGKTTTTVGLGASLASLRGDRVIAVDANPDRGTLSDKVRLETATTVRDLLNEHEQIQRYADVRAYTSQSSSRLEVLASDRDPAVSEAFSEEDYRTVAHVLEHFYSICLTDCGTGLLHSAMAGVLGLANQLVLVSSPSVDGARSASATLDWLEAHHYGDLVRGGVVVLSMVRSRSRSTVDLDRLEAHFESRCRAVVRIPYDPHLEEGAEVELEQLSSATLDAYLVLAATVGDGFAWPH